MTTTTASSSVHQSSASSRNRGLALAGFVASAIATAVGTFWDVTGNEASDKDQSETYLPVLGMILVFLALAYGLGVRGAAQGNASRRAAILGVLAVLTIVVFWAGAPLVLASAALACALIDRDRLGSFGTGSKVGLGLAGLATAAAAWLAIAG